MAALWFGVLFPLSENFVYDSLTALSLMIAFYYALNGFSCAIYYRRELTKSVKNFLFIGVGPVVGGLMLGFLFVKAIIEYSKTDQSYRAARCSAWRSRWCSGSGYWCSAWCYADLAPRGTGSSSGAGARSWIRTSPGSSRRRGGPGGGGLMARSCSATTPRRAPSGRSRRRSSWRSRSATGC